MNKILILKDVAYAAVSSGAAISTVADLERLAQGAIAVFDQDGAIIDHTSLTGTYENLIFAAGVANGEDGEVYNNLTVPVPVVVDRWNVQAYQAPVKPVVQVGALITKQVDSITLSGTSGTANVTLAGGLTKTVTFGTDLATTAAAFVSSHAAAYLAVDIVVTSTSTGATNGVLVFTASVGGTSFVSPAIANATGDLAGTVVNTTANITGTTLQFETTGDYNVTVKDNTYTNKYGIQTVSGSGYRQTYHTEEGVVDDVVAKLNKVGSFVVATKTGNSTDGWGISVTPKKDGVILGVSVSGMFEGTPVYSDGTKGSTVQVFGMGTSEIVAQLEQDFSVNVGNSNSIEYRDEYYSVPTETVSGALYEMINLQWKGTHESPSSKKTVMNNRLVIAGINGSTILDNVQTILTGILTTTGSKTVS